MANAGRLYERPKGHVWCIVEVLPQLWGRVYDDDAKAMLMSLRPSFLRETYGSISLDARTWRVTVFLIDKEGVPYVKYIEQEVQAGPVGDDDDGDELKRRIEEKMDPATKDFIDRAIT